MQDGIINDHDIYSFKGKVAVTHVDAEPFVKDIWEIIHYIQTRVVAFENCAYVLENHVNILDLKVKSLEQVSTNIVITFKLLQNDIHNKQKIDAVTGMMRVSLDGISFSIA
eukprot:12090414-Ditylum_brightwellii.AAC.1